MAAYCIQKNQGRVLQMWAKADGTGKTDVRPICEDDTERTG